MGRPIPVSPRLGHETAFQGVQLTIGVVVKVNDGYVLASDSATTIAGETPGHTAIANIYNNANKIFAYVRASPRFRDDIQPWKHRSRINLYTYEGSSGSIRRKVRRAQGLEASKRNDYTARKRSLSAQELLWEEHYKPFADAARLTARKLPLLGLSLLATVPTKAIRSVRVSTHTSRLPMARFCPCRYHPGLPVRRQGEAITLTGTGYGYTPKANQSQGLKG